MGVVDVYKDFRFYIYAETKDKFVMRKQLKKKSIYNNYEK